MAAEVARRVLTWATQHENGDADPAAARSEEPAWRAAHEV